MTEPYEKEPYWKLVTEFVNELKTATYWMKPDGKPNKEWVLFERDTIREARDAASDAARVAACDAARDAAGDAAWDAAGAAAGAASWDAALFARLIVCNGLQVKTEHLRHANARMNVWRKGYCLHCDVNGKLYVYAAKKKEKQQ